LNFIRFIFLISAVFVTYAFIDTSDIFLKVWAGLGALLFIALLFFMDIRFHHRRTGRLLAGIVGMILGLLLARLISYQVADPILSSYTDKSLSPAVLVMISLVLGYLGLLVGKGSVGELRVFNTDGEDGEGRLLFVVDQDSMIDGRVVKLAKTPILPGEIVVPRLVVDSLESMAASADQVLRFRGKRGLENLRSMEREQAVRLYVRQVTSKSGQEGRSIVEYARKHGATIISKNADLERQAAKNGLPVINFNSLAELLAPEVIQGDELVIKLVKAGKELDQAVGYLENGNMVVVENSRKEIGKTVRITVTGIHQTKAGTLVFAQLKE